MANGNMSAAIQGSIQGMTNGFIFSGFQPEEAVVSKSQDIFWRMDSKAPATSANLASIEMKDGNYVGTVRMSSVTCNFLADAVGIDPIAVIEDLYTQIHAQIAKWNESRFSFIE